MFNLLKYLFIGLTTTFLLTGCSVKQHTKAFTTKDRWITPEQFDSVVYDNYKIKLATSEVVKNYDVITVITRSGYSNFQNIIYNKSTYAALQQAAFITKKDGKKYFSFAYPAAISNYHGSLINTPKEFIDKCEINVGHVFILGLNACGFNIKPNKTVTQIITFNEQPNDFVAYNADEVLDYLKTNNYYEEEITSDEIVLIHKFINKQVLEDF